MKINNSTTVKNPPWQAVDKVQDIDHIKIINKKQHTTDPKNSAAVATNKNLIVTHQNIPNTQSLGRSLESKISPVSSESFSKVDINITKLQEID